MTAERWGRIKAIFDSALEEAPEERPSFVEQACAGDEGILREVLDLIREHEEIEHTQTFLKAPIADFGYSLAAGEAIASRYQVLRLLGRGGMGEVYEVRDQFLDEAAALKTLRADLCLNPSLVRRFQMEIQLARRVTHPNVCRVYEVGVHEFEDAERPPLHFFTMQLLEGETLSARIRRVGRLAKGEAFPLIAQMAEGLAAAHAAGIVHRDFKSGNVMLADGRAVITDFGLAGLETPQVAGGGSEPITAKFGGTVPYMSPEQLSGGSVGAASDIYSLGVVLFEMATGQLPFDSQHIIHSAMQRVRRNTPAVRALVPDIDPRWEAAIRRCLEVEPERRFRSAAEVAELFAQERWRLPRVYWTRRQYALAAAGAAIAPIFGATWWVESHRPYQPNPEAAKWYRRGVEALRSVTYEAARRDLEQAVAMDSRYAPAFADLAAAYGELDQSEPANQLMILAVSRAQEERLSERDATRVKAMQYVIARDFDKARPLFERLLAIAPQPEKAGAYVDLAWLALKREDNPGTIPPLEAALKLNPSLAGAKLRLAMALHTQGQKDRALQLFQAAEALFHSASDYDGEVESLLQEATALAQSSHTSEAINLIRRALDIASSTGDLHHEVRLKLALALAYRNGGDPDRSSVAAEEAVRTALENRMDATAAGGLVELGTAFYQRGEPEPAERYFRQSLDLANRGRAIHGVAQAQFMLCSLLVQYDRPTEALPYIQPASTFFQSAGYRREGMQSLLALGVTQDKLAQLDEAEKNIRESIRLAERIHETEQSGIARLYLANVFEEAGRWPDAMAETDRALGSLGEVRGGFRAAFALSDRGRLWAKIGNFRQAEEDLSNASIRAERLQGKQANLRAELMLGESELAYYRRQWPQALRFARLAMAEHGGVDKDLEAELLAGLCTIHLGDTEKGMAASLAAVNEAESKGRAYPVASGKLALASALSARGLFDEASRLAQDALAFFQQHQIFEAIWRCHRILDGRAKSGQHWDASQTALTELKQMWPEEMVQSYLARPDLTALAR